MSIIQDLYKIFDSERSRYEAKKSSRNAVLRELAANLAFIREGLVTRMSAKKIVEGLENQQFGKAADSGFDFDSIKKGVLAPETYANANAKEFEKYKGWSTKKLVENAYERLNTIKKLQTNGQSINVESRLKYLFKYLMVVMAHVDGKNLTIR